MRFPCLRETKNRCQEKRGLEFDHIKPFALGGTNDIKNIRLLCRNCNQREAFKIFGEDSRFMMPLNWG
jgi:5-methylcytosine-specific restriction endonuclease McrA